MKRKSVPVTMGSARSRTAECTGCTVTEAWFPAGAMLPPHTHDRAIFAVTLTGSIESAIQQRRLDCSAASVWTEPLGERHANAIGGDGARVVVVQPDHAREDLFGPFARFLDGVRLARHAGVAADAIRVAAELDVDDGLSRLAIDGLILTMLSSSARAFESRAFHAPPPSWLLTARDYLHAQFRHSLEMTDVAAAAGVRPAQLARAFRRHFRCTPGDYVRGLRVRWAAERLATSDVQISRIAIAAGFSDQSHLTREFRRRIGMTPGVYRRNARPPRRECTDM